MSATVGPSKASTAPGNLDGEVLAHYVSQAPFDPNSVEALSQEQER